MGQILHVGLDFFAMIEKGLADAVDIIHRDDAASGNHQKWHQSEKNDSPRVCQDRNSSKNRGPAGRG